VEEKGRVYDRDVRCDEAIVVYMHNIEALSARCLNTLEVNLLVCANMDHLDHKAGLRRY
jgi:hypothetical protein